MTALAFLEPMDGLFSAHADGSMYIWSAPPHKDAGVARARWFGPPHHVHAITSVAVVDTANHPTLSLRGTRLRARMGSMTMGGCEKPKPRGFVLFTGDEAGYVHRWELTEEFLLVQLGLRRVRRWLTTEPHWSSPCVLSCTAVVARLTACLDLLQWSAAWAAPSSLSTPWPT